MLNISPAETEKLQARIIVIGAGGAGCNAINNMIDKKLPGVQFISMNTDTQSLSKSHAPTKIQLGQDATQGLGAGANPDVGRAAALESESKIQAELKGAHMVFITAGMGGGTGTGSAPVIARLSKDMGILTVGVVTKPFKFERQRRADIAESGIRELQQFVDTLIVIPNENLFRLNDGPTTMIDAFAHADDVLLSGVRGVTDLIVQEGRINLDFNDIKTVMKEMGKAVMGTGEASGENRAQVAAEQAINNPLLEDISLKGASSLLINITSGTDDVTLDETNEAVNIITKEASEDALVIFGLTVSEELGDKIRISMIATGVESDYAPSPTSGGGTSRGFSAGSPTAAGEPKGKKSEPQVSPAPAMAAPNAAAAPRVVQPEGISAATVAPQPVQATNPQISPTLESPPTARMAPKTVSEATVAPVSGSEPEGLFASQQSAATPVASERPAIPPRQQGFIPPMPQSTPPSAAPAVTPTPPSSAAALSSLRQQNPSQPEAEQNKPVYSNIPRFLRR